MNLRLVTSMLQGVGDPTEKRLRRERQRKSGWLDSNVYTSTWQPKKALKGFFLS